MRFRQNFLPLLSASLVGLIKVAYANTVVHDASFVPDASLHVSTGVRKQSCVPEKEILLVNGTSPGPELKFTEGKTVWIRVYNDMVDQNLTMHWHGLTQAVAPFSDGTPAASQWPIPPAHFFDYELHVPVGMAGTYFYHSHVGIQAMSATGPLNVVEADHPPYHYDGERIIFIQDVYRVNDSYLEQGLAHRPIIYDGDQTMVLINGRGAGITNYGDFCNETLSVINVQPGKTYRLRLIGGMTQSFDSLAIEGHDNLEVIEADATYTKKHSTSFMQIGAGQRFSVLLHTKSKPDKQQYFLQLETRDRDNTTTSYAVINYGPPAFYGPPGASESLATYGPPSNSSSSGPSFYPPAKAPLILPPTDINFLEYELAPHHSSTYSSHDMPTAAEVTRRVNITVHLIEPGNQLIYLLNGYPWYEDVPTEPYLVSLYKNDGKEWPSMERALQNDGLDPITRAFPAKIGEVLEIVIQNTGSEGNEMETHPWHAHGAHYWDLGSGLGVYNQAENEAKWKHSKGKPVKRDTTMLYRNVIYAKNNTLAGWRAWRLRVEQPGVWMVHCHILLHMIFGMQTAWVMGNSTEVLGNVPRPDVEGYLTYGGSVMGNASHFPEVVQFFDFPTWANAQ